MTAQGGGTNLGSGYGPVEPFLRNTTGDVILARCTVANLPTGQSGYAIACEIQASDNGAQYSNTGTTSSATWTLLESSIGGTATALVDSNGVTALDSGATASAVNNLRATNSATGAVTANAVLLSAVGTDAAVSIQVSPKGVTGKLTLGLATGTGDITLGSSSGAQSVKIGDGAGVSTVNIANNGATGNVVNVATGAFASTITIGNTTGATAVAYLAGSGKHIFTGVINATSPVFVTPALGAASATSLTMTGAYTGKSGTAVPATAGAVAAGAPLIMNSNGMTIEWTTDAPTHTRPKGSVCFNINGSSASTRGYINTDGAGTWTPITTVG